MKLISISTGSRSRSNQDPIAGNRYGWHAQFGRAMAEQLPYQVECWTLDVAADREVVESHDGILYRLFPADRHFAVNREWSRPMLKALDDSIRRDDPIIHVHDVHSWLAYAITRRFPGAKLVGHHHGASRPPLQRLRLAWPRILGAPLFIGEQLIENASLNVWRHCFVVNNASGRYFRDRQVPVSFCPMAPDLESIVPRSRSAARQRLGLDPNQVVLLSAGGWSKPKNLELYVRVVAELQKLQPVRAVLLGHTYDHRLRSAITALADRLGLTERLAVVDHVSRTELSWYYAAADALLITSTADEGGPMTAVEACAVGLPVVSTPVGFIPDIVARAGGRIATAPADPTSFAANVSRVVSGQSRAKREPVTLWTWNDVARTIGPVYKSLAASA